MNDESNSLSNWLKQNDRKWKAIGAIFFIIGLASLPDDLQTWWKWIIWMSEKGISSWLFIITGILLLTHGHLKVLFKAAKNWMEKDAQKQQWLTVTDVLIIGIGSFALLFPFFFILKFVLLIEVPRELGVACYFALQIYIYLRRLKKTGREQIRGEIYDSAKKSLTFWGGILLIAVMGTIFAQIILFIRIWFHNNVLPPIGPIGP